jgi:dihydrofolate reductase
MKLTLIAAVARNGVIGKGNELLCHLPEDQQHFRRVTMGCPVIMGRRTWDSLSPRFRPLPGRRNIVVTRSAQWKADGAEAEPSLAAALARVETEAKVFVIGGGELYREAIARADEIMLTEIERDFGGDTHFPAWDRSLFREVSREAHHAGPPNDFDYAFVTYQRNLRKSSHV